MTSERGSSLLEAVVALAVMSLALLGGLQSLLSAEAAARESRTHGTALRAVQQALDDGRMGGTPAEATVAGPSAAGEAAIRWHIVRPDPHARYRWLQVEGRADPARPDTRPAVLRTMLADPDPASLAALLQPAPQTLLFPAGQPILPSTDAASERASMGERTDDHPLEAVDGAFPPAADCAPDSDRRSPSGAAGPESDCPPAHSIRP